MAIVGKCFGSPSKYCPIIKLLDFPPIRNKKRRHSRSLLLDLKRIKVVSIGHMTAFYVAFVPLEYIPIVFVIKLQIMPQLVPLI